MTETRTPLEIPENYGENNQRFLEELCHTYTTTGTITEEHLGKVIQQFQLTESLLKATTTFVNVADRAVAVLEKAVEEKEAEIALLKITHRDLERDLELADPNV